MLEIGGTVELKYMKHVRFPGKVVLFSKVSIKVGKTVNEFSLSSKNIYLKINIMKKTLHYRLQYYTNGMHRQAMKEL